MECSNIILLILEVLVLLKPGWTRELVAPGVWKHWRVCSTVDSKLLFTMDPGMLFTMDFLLNSLNIILGVLIQFKLYLVGELVLPCFSCFPRLCKHRHVCL